MFVQSCLFFSGKRNRLVPALVDSFLEEAYDFIHSNREAFDIPPGNVFLNPNPGTLGKDIDSKYIL